MKELFEAVRAGDLERVRALVEADPALAIFAASIQGDTAELERLLSANRGLLTSHSSDGWTPLHLAAYFGKMDAVKFLLNKGAKADARSTNEMRNLPIHAAAAGRHKDVIQLLIEHGSAVNAAQHGGWTPMHAAALNGDIEAAKVLMAAGADMGARAENHQRPIDLALTAGKQAMVEFLEAVGARL